MKTKIVVVIVVILVIAVLGYLFFYHPSAGKKCSDLYSPESALLTECIAQSFCNEYVEEGSKMACSDHAPNELELCQDYANSCSDSDAANYCDSPDCFMSSASIIASYLNQTYPALDACNHITNEVDQKICISNVAGLTALNNPDVAVEVCNNQPLGQSSVCLSSVSLALLEKQPAKAREICSQIPEGNFSCKQFF